MRPPIRSDDRTERFEGKNRVWTMVRDIAVAALIFQTVHFVEHIAQLSFWMMNPGAAPWLTPWAEVGRDLLVVDGTPGSGNELLHLLGNLVFLMGLAALLMLARHDRQALNEVPYLRQALAVQGLHVVEHLALTITYLTVGSAIGVTTLFGTAEGAFGSSLRVWAHFLLNLVATYYGVRAAIRLLLPASDNRGLIQRELA